MNDEIMMTMRDCQRNAGLVGPAGPIHSKSVVYSIHMGRAFVSGITDRGRAAQSAREDHALPVGDFIFVLWDGLVTEYEVVSSNNGDKVFRMGQQQVGPSTNPKPGALGGTAHGVGHVGQRGNR